MGLRLWRTFPSCSALSGCPGQPQDLGDLLCVDPSPGAEVWAGVKVEMASGVSAEEKVWGDLIMTFQDLQGGQERWRDHFPRPGGTGVALGGVLGTSPLLWGWLGCQGISVNPGKEVWDCLRLGVSSPWPWPAPLCQEH